MNIVKWQPDRGWFVDVVRPLGWAFRGVGDYALLLWRSAWRPALGWSIVAAILYAFVLAPWMGKPYPPLQDVLSLIAAAGGLVVVRGREKRAGVDR